MFERGEKVYDLTEKDTKGNSKKTLYWVCCQRTTADDIREYRLKEKKPDDWDQVQCNGQHEGHWVAEQNLADWV